MTDGRERDARPKWEQTLVGRLKALLIREIFEGIRHAFGGR